MRSWPGLSLASRLARWVTPPLPSRAPPTSTAPPLTDEVGFSFYDLPAEGGRPYWNESAAYSFTPAEVDLLERATSELFDLCMEACERVVRQGRFDLAYDNAGTVKLLEFNADTPTSLVETAAAQRQWLLETQGPDADQFNSLHEQLIQQWRGFGSSGKSGFGSTVGG
ncbi:glutathionylspermidine synthase family protein [Rathayibacter rathayi]|uniref:glutathionylspermidine synthase family protein n=1 Tax=Rathayibacter rathayi TaxID=33887 RepID=UPI000CE87EEE|nr:glutathionylspermidine synthase family protein [Rathayibacter rathayi]PPG69234.1 hypothetical protein C5C02_06780 [Rathayibacter rathayi]